MLITLLTLLTAPVLALNILIDPGHGGNDTGAIRGKLKESQIALKVAQKLADQLKADGRFSVNLTRTRDQFLTLEQRTEISQKIKPDIFLSIHLNSFSDERVRGKEVYFQNQMPPDEEAMYLASKENVEASATDRGPSSTEKASEVQLIIEDLKRSHRIRVSGYLSQQIIEAWKAGAGRHPASPRKVGTRALRQAPFRVLLNNDVPAVLVEVGYLTHPEEGKLLGTEAYQEEIARSLFTGISRYKDSVDKYRTGPL